MTFAYFAYPIDVVINHGHQGAARARVRQAMHLAGWSVFEPGTIFRMGVDTSEQNSDPRVQEINNEAIDRADIVVALLPVESHSVGVPIEIQRAADRGTTVYVWRQVPSWAIAREGVYQFEGIKQLCDAITNYGDVTSDPLVKKRFDELFGTVEKASPDAAGLWDHAMASFGDRPNVQMGGAAVQWAYTHSVDCQVRVTGEGELPTRKYADDAGFDLYVDGNWVIQPQAEHGAPIPCSIAVELPPGWWGLLVGRSSTFERGLIINPGIIDPGYRGELFAIARNLRSEPVEVAHGERIAQLIPIPAFPPDVPVRRVDKLSWTERGSNGFGSSGR